MKVTRKPKQYKEYSKITILGCIVWMIGAIFFLYEFFLRASIAPMTHMLEHDLGTTAGGIALISSGYYLSYSIMQIPVGILIDKMGVRKILFSGALFCAFGTFLFSFSVDAYTAYAGRFLMGLGSAVGFVALLSICLQWFPRRWFGLLSGMTQVLGACGPIIAGAPLALWLIYTHDNWREIMGVVAAIGIALAIAAFLFIRNRPLTISKGATKHRQKISLKQKLKLIFKIKQPRWIAAYAFFIYPTAPLVGALWGVSLLQKYGFSLTDATLINSMLWIGMAVASPIVGGLSDGFSRRKPFLIFYGLVGIASILLTLYLPVQHTWVYIVLFFVMGVSTGGQTLAFAVMSENVPRAIQSTSMGFCNMAVMLGATVIQAISGYIFSHIGSHSKLHDSTMSLHAYQMAIGVQVIFLVVACLLAIFMIKETYANPLEE